MAQVVSDSAEAIEAQKNLWKPFLVAFSITFMFCLLIWYMSILFVDKNLEGEWANDKQDRYLFTHNYWTNNTTLYKINDDVINTKVKREGNALTLTCDKLKVPKKAIWDGKDCIIFVEDGVLLKRVVV
jgi:hypothetical protein